MRGFVRADLIADLEEAMRRIDFVEFRVEDWSVKTELDDAKRALERIREKLEEVEA